MTPVAIAAAAIIVMPVLTIRRGLLCLLLLWYCFIGVAPSAIRARLRREPSTIPAVSCCYLLRLGGLPDALAGSQQGRQHVELHATQDFGRPVPMPTELVHPQRQPRSEEHLNKQNPGAEDPVHHHGDLSLVG